MVPQQRAPSGANTRIAARLEVSVTSVKSWRERFAAEGMSRFGVVNHMILDSYRTHTHDDVIRWLSQHTRLPHTDIQLLA
jgi:hypothetical protein